MHLGHTRWAAVGDALGRVLSAAGGDVAREYYFNDRGSQMDKFGLSVVALATGEPVPEDGYGAYVADLAARVVADRPDILDLAEPERAVAFREEGYRILFAEQQALLAGFGTEFDVWFHEDDLHDGGGSVDRRPGEAARPGPPLRRGRCRCGCGRRSSATTRTGC